MSRNPPNRRTVAKRSADARRAPCDPPTRHRASALAAGKGEATFRRARRHPSAARPGRNSRSTGMRDAYAPRWDTAEAFNALASEGLICVGRGRARLRGRRDFARDWSRSPTPPLLECARRASQKLRSRRGTSKWEAGRGGGASLKLARRSELIVSGGRTREREPSAATDHEFHHALVSALRLQAVLEMYAGRHPTTSTCATLRSSVFRGLAVAPASIASSRLRAGPTAGAADHHGPRRDCVRQMLPGRGGRRNDPLPGTRRARLSHAPRSPKFIDHHPRAPRRSPAPRRSRALRGDQCVRSKIGRRIVATLHARMRSREDFACILRCTRRTTRCSPTMASTLCTCRA